MSTYSQLHSFADGVAAPAAPQAKVIDGKAISAEIRVELAEDVEQLQQVTGKVRRLSADRSLAVPLCVLLADAQQAPAHAGARPGGRAGWHAWRL